MLVVLGTVSVLTMTSRSLLLPRNRRIARGSYFPL
uniref:Uncharacterized protein n=1 Tax=Arundo donax TaxID=35708 RepID=A0A0A9A1L3_ARUDO